MNDRPKHVAVYVRVSKNDQNVENQVPDLNRWLEAYVEPDKKVIWYEDRGESAYAKKSKRPAWERLKRDTMSGAVEKIVVWSIDRCMRKLTNFLAFIDHLDEQQVPLISIREPYLDGSTAAGQFMRGIMGLVAEFESKRRSERVKAGLAAVTPARRKKWKKPGTKPGTETMSKEKLAMMKTLLEAGHSPTRVARVVHSTPHKVYEKIRRHGWKYPYKRAHMRLGTEWNEQQRKKRARNKLKENGELQLQQKLAAPAPQEVAAQKLQELLEEEDD